MINKLIKKIEKNLSVKGKIAIGLVVLALLSNFAYNLLKPNDMILSAVKITNIANTSGGSGVILSSKENESLIITNSHVCRVIENGGYVHTNSNSYFVDSYKHSLNHDLCLIKVLDNLKINTKIASSRPIDYYEEAFIAGHPKLLPTVVTSGHFSGKMVITVLIGLKKCTAEDLQDSDNAMYCIFFGGIPVVKNYVSTLVTATIMPGSSGSGVYNKHKALTGLAFAGSGDLGYAWTVPYEYLKLFMEQEADILPFIKAKTEMAASSSKETGVQRVVRSCNTATTESPDTVKKICELVRKDLIWRQK